MYTVHTCTHKAAKPATATQLLLLSEPALRCLCAIQALQSSAGKSSWGRASNPQKSHEKKSWNPEFHNDSQTIRRDEDSWAFASPVYTWYPSMLQLCGLYPQLVPGHRVPIYIAGAHTRTHTQSKAKKFLAAGPHPLVDMDSSFDICFPSYYQVPIDVIAGGATSLVYTRSPIYTAGQTGTVLTYTHTHIHTHTYTHTQTDCTT